ncbi:MAG: ANTAR domain-containing protein [Pseudomonadota bacterium]
MTTALLIQSPDNDAPALAADLAAAGFAVLGPAGCAHLVREALRGSPDVVVCWDPRPDGSLLEAVRVLQAQMPLPVLVFTQDASVELMDRALAAGVHAWVVQGYGPQRLRPLVHLARAREAHERKLQEALAELAGRFEERKLVDKAKGILMRASHVSEDEAFRLLRTASMHANQRVGQVSRQVIDAAQAAEAINRAGQQRMLSQRLVKLYALACSRTDAASAALVLKQSVARVEDNLTVLGKTLSAATFGDLLSAARAGWAPVLRILEDAPRAAQLAALDGHAEAMLAQADALVTALETSGLATTVHVINTSGRQRMLSQRVAKLALLAVQGEPLAATVRAFEDGMATLARAPLSTSEIRDTLAAAQVAWRQLLDAVPRAGEAAGRKQLALASEELLALFDRLTDAYQHSMQVLMG